MPDREKIDRYSIVYALLRTLGARMAHYRYYRKITIINRKIIPKGEPVILAPNHQNALMDAMAIVVPVWWYQVVFFARADIFKKKAVINFLTFCKIMPVYRRRDGLSSVKNNDEIFDYGAKFLHNKHNPICIFPEGNHGKHRRLRQLVKGIFRIAFAAQEEYKNKPGVKIIPTGLDYGHYQKFRNDVLIQYGEPIEVSEYWNAYQENNAVGINKLRDRLSQEIKKLMIHIQTEEYYYLYMNLRSFYTYRVCEKLGLKYSKLFQRFKADKAFIDAMDAELEQNPENIAKLQEHFNKYQKGRDKLKLRDWVFRKKKYSVIGNLFLLLFNLVLSPIAALGLFNNWAHFIIPPRISKKMVKDPQFVSTFNWGLGLVIHLLYSLILLILALVFIPFWWLKLAYILTMWKSGLVSLYCRKLWLKSKARIQYTRNRKKPIYQNTIKEKETVESMLEQILEKHLRTPA